MRARIPRHRCSHRSGRLCEMVERRITMPFSHRSLKSETSCLVCAQRSCVSARPRSTTCKSCRLIPVFIRPDDPLPLVRNFHQQPAREPRPAYQHFEGTPPPPAAYTVAQPPFWTLPTRCVCLAVGTYHHIRTSSNTVYRLGKCKRNYSS